MGINEIPSSCRPRMGLNDKVALASFVVAAMTIGATLLYPLLSLLSGEYCANSSPVLYPLYDLSIDGLPLKRDQTEREVRAILGPPKRVSGHGYWDYPGGTGSLTVDFRAGPSGTRPVRVISGWRLFRGRIPVIWVRQPESEMFALLGRPWRRVSNSVSWLSSILGRVNCYPVADSEGVFGHIYIYTYAGSVSSSVAYIAQQE